MARDTLHFYSFFRKWFWQELIFGMATMVFGLGKPSQAQAKNWAYLARDLLSNFGFYDVWLNQGVGNIQLF